MLDKNLLKRPEYKNAIDMYDFAMSDISKSKEIIINEKLGIGDETATDFLYKVIANQIFDALDDCMRANRESLVYLLLNNERGEL